MNWMVGVSLYGITKIIQSIEKHEFGLARLAVAAIMSRNNVYVKFILIYVQLH